MGPLGTALAALGQTFVQLAADQALEDAQKLQRFEEEVARFRANSAAHVAAQAQADAAALRVARERDAAAVPPPPAPPAAPAPTATPSPATPGSEPR